MLSDFPRPAFILDRTASVWRNEAYSCLFRFVLFLFLSPTPTTSCVSSSASNEETIATAEKTIKTTKAGLITVCKGDSSAGYKIDCFASEEREHRF